MVFDEASLWWSLEKQVLPDSKEFEDKLQEKLGEYIVQIQSNPDEADGDVDDS